MADKTEKPTKDLPVPNADKVIGGRKPLSEDPDAGGEITKRKG